MSALDEMQKKFKTEYAFVTRNGVKWLEWKTEGEEDVVIWIGGLKITDIYSYSAHSYSISIHMLPEHNGEGYRSHELYLGNDRVAMEKFIEGLRGALGGAGVWVPAPPPIMKNYD